MPMDASTVFEQLGGVVDGTFPAIHSEAFSTDAGTPYLKHAGVVMLAKPQVHVQGMRPFLEGFGEDLDFGQYVDDPTELPPASQLMKTAGQTCYASFGPQRTYNENAKRYF